jgi:hypothetical protein
MVHVVAATPCVCLYLEPTGRVRFKVCVGAVPVRVAAAVSPEDTVPIDREEAGPGLPGAATVTTLVAPSLTIVAVLVLVTVTVSEL